MNEPLIGIWELTGYQAVMEDGSVSVMDDIAGTLVYTGNGWMSEALRLRSGQSEPVNVFYSGTYTVEGETLFHQPLVHINPDMVGQMLPRTTEFDGHDKFTLIAPRAGGESRLTWKRVV
jgi:hypothetical protein